MRLELWRGVGEHRGHHVARAHPARGQGRSQLTDSGVIVQIAAPGLAVDQRDAVRKHLKGAVQMRQRREGNEIGRTFFKTCFVFQPAHMLAPPSCDVGKYVASGRDYWRAARQLKRGKGSKTR